MTIFEDLGNYPTLTLSGIFSLFFVFQRAKSAALVKPEEIQSLIINGL